MATRTGATRSCTGELALDEHGKALGLRVDALHDMGSHVFDASMVVPLFALKLAPGVYQIPAVYAAGRAVLTNTPPLQPYRGAGRPEATYLIERLLDRAAHVIGIDPIEIRRRNFVPPSAMPHKLHSGIAYDCGEFMRVMDECLKLADWSGFPKRAAESKKNGKLRGRGIGYFIEEAAIFNDRMDHSLRSERHAHDPCRHPFARPGPCKQSTRRWCTNGSACRLIRSASFRATPTRLRSAAAPMARAACMSAATRSSAPPTPSSRRPSPWRP